MESSRAAQSIDSTGRRQVTMRVRKAGGFALRSRTVGALPIVNRFLKRMQLQRVLDGYLPSDDKRMLPLNKR